MPIAGTPAECLLGGPSAGPELLGCVCDNVYQRDAGIRVGARKDLRGDLQEIRLKRSGVPGAQDSGGFASGKAGRLAQQVTGLGDELHDGVLDAVVDCFDQVTGAVRADQRAAWPPPSSAEIASSMGRAWS